MDFFFLSCQEDMKKFICQSCLDVFWSLLYNLEQIVVCLLCLVPIKEESSSVGELCSVGTVEVLQIPHWGI